MSQTYRAAEERRELAGVVLGQCGSGKSTLLGRLLCDVSQSSLSDEEKSRVEKDLLAAGRVDCRYSWLLDTSHDERESGGSIDLAQRKFKTEKYNVTITDCPGNVNFLKNALRGTSQADFAFIVIDASASTNEAVYELPLQTKEHCLVSYAFGIRQVIAVVTKMEHTLVSPYSSQIFSTIRTQITGFLVKTGFELCNIQVVPTSALSGENVVDRSQRFPWHKGPSVLQAVNQIKCPRRTVLNALRIPVQDVYKIRGVGTVVAGRVASGMLHVGMKVSFSPGGSCSEIGSIELNGNAVDKAIAGDTIGISLKGVAAKEIKRGYVCGPADDLSLGSAVSFTVCLTIVNHPGKVSVGYSPVMYCHTAQFRAKVLELVAKIDRQSGRVIENKPSFLQQGEAGIVRLAPEKQACIETLYDFPALGRLVVRDLQKIIAVGVVASVSKRGAG